MSSSKNPNEKPEKQVIISVNTKPFTVDKEKYSYEEIVQLAYPAPDYATHTYKVTYFWDPNGKDGGHVIEGALSKGGQPVNVKDEMSFTVVRAVKS